MRSPKTKESFFSKITKAVAGKSTVDEEVLMNWRSAERSMWIGCYGKDLDQKKPEWLKTNTEYCRAQQHLTAKIESVLGAVPEKIPMVFIPTCLQSRM